MGGDRSVRHRPDRRPARGAAHVRGLHDDAGSVQQHGTHRGRRPSGGASTSGPAAASTASIRQADRSGTTPVPRRPARRPERPCGTVTAHYVSTRPAESCASCPRLDLPQRSPPILITALQVGGRPQPISAIGEPEVRLTEPSSRNTHLQIDFVSLGFSHGGELRYQVEARRRR